MTTKMFSLKWKNFKENIISNFLSLRNDTDFNDVTLVCEENNQVEAHKVILAASSSFFKNILKRNKHSHPLIYMKGMQYEDLLALLEFMYQGETHIYHENIDSFLRIAEDLGLNGLAGETNYYKEEYRPDLSPPFKTSRKKVARKSKIYDTPQQPVLDINIQPQEPSFITSSQNKDFIPNETFSLAEENTDAIKIETTENFMETVSSMIIKTNETWTCNLCGKVSNDRSNLRKHVETIHTQGLTFSCKSCDKLFRSRKRVYHHMASMHKHNN